MGRIVIWSVPQPLQDWDDEQDHRKVEWFELFYDLIFVAVAVQLAAFLYTFLSWSTFGIYLLMFTMFWWVWCSFTNYVTRFYGDDLIHTHVYFLTAIIGVAVMATFVSTTENRLFSGHAGFAVGFIITRIGMIVMYSIIYYWIVKFRTYALFLIVGMGISVAFSIASIFYDDATASILLGVGICGEFGSGMFTTLLSKYERIPVHVDHLTERHGLFVMLVLGESILTLLAGPLEFDTEHYIIVIVGIILVVALYVSYFDAQPEIPELHALRTQNGRLFIYLHLLLSCSLLTIGIALKIIIKSLASGNVTEVTLGNAWIFCAPNAIEIMLLLWLRYLHKNKVASSPVLLSFRLIGSVITILLPLAYESLTPVSIVCIVTAIHVSLVVGDLVVIMRGRFAEIDFNMLEGYELAEEEGAWVGLRKEKFQAYVSPAGMVVHPQADTLQYMHERSNVEMFEKDQTIDSVAAEDLEALQAAQDYIATFEYLHPSYMRSLSKNGLLEGSTVPRARLRSDASQTPSQMDISMDTLSMHQRSGDLITTPGPRDVPTSPLFTIGDSVSLDDIREESLPTDFQVLPPSHRSSVMSWSEQVSEHDESENMGSSSDRLALPSKTDLAPSHSTSRLSAVPGRLQAEDLPSKSHSADHLAVSRPQSLWKSRVRQNPMLFRGSEPAILSETAAGPVSSVSGESDPTTSPAAGLPAAQPRPDPWRDLMSHLMRERMLQQQIHGQVPSQASSRRTSIVPAEFRAHARQSRRRNPQADRSTQFFYI